MVEITPSQKRQAKGRILAHLDFLLDEELEKINGSLTKLAHFRALVDQRNYIARIFGCSEIKIPKLTSIEQQCRQLN